MVGGRPRPRQQKPNGGVCPITLIEALVKLVTGSAADMSRRGLQRSLRDISTQQCRQIGCEDGGPEQSLQLARLLQRAYPNHAFGPLDTKTAFSTADSWQSVESLQQRSLATAAASLAMCCHRALKAQIYPNTPHHRQIYIPEGVLQGDQASASQSRNVKTEPSQQCGKSGKWPGRAPEDQQPKRHG